MTVRKFADADGITELWSKVKSHVSGAVPTKVSDLTNDTGYITGMTILSYGSSTWSDFITAYNANKVVYCRASSNSNPATGAQNRMAFLAYVNGATPTEVEFQYYRSVNSHSASQQGDQVFVYKLNSSGTWSVTTREASSIMAAGTGLTSSYSSGVLTFSLADTYGDTKNPYGTKTANYVLAGPTSGSAAAPSFRALVAADIPDLSNIYLTDVEVDGVSVVTNGIAEINSEVFSFYITYDDNQDTYSASVSFSDIAEAYLAHKTIFCLYSSYGSVNFYHLHYYNIEPGEIGFVSSAEDYSDEFCIYDDETVERYEYTIIIPSKTSDLTNDAGFVTTDEKVSTAAVTGGFTYYPVVGSNTTSAETKYYDVKGFSYVSTQGSSSGYSGSSVLNLGSSSNAGSVDGRYGELRIYSGDGKYIGIRTAATVAINKSITLPNNTGTIALTSDIPTRGTAASGGTTLSLVNTGDMYTWNNKQDALVSGTNIKTVNNESLLGSGNIAVQTAITSQTVSISVANWNATTTCTKSVTGVTSSNNVIVAPAPSSMSDWASSGVYCSAQGSGTLTFTASTTPSADMTVNVMIIN